MYAIQLNPSTLAFVGDAVYGLLVRSFLASESKQSGDLHAQSVKFVNAAAQAKAYMLIEPLLTETEISVFKRGRNLHTKTTPKNSSVSDYHTATGLETLFGYLYLNGEQTRIEELFSFITKNT